MREKQPEEDKSYEKNPERPLECSECKKPIDVIYTEIVGGSITRLSMCADCPELQKRLQGSSAIPSPGALGEGNIAGLACGVCGTTLDSVRVGTLLGCSECYSVFEDILLTELLSMGKVPPRLATTKKSASLHIGRAPGESQEMNPSLRLLALNEALSETLKKEDYEQAAWLRDQIKALTENPEKGDAGKQS